MFRVCLSYLLSLHHLNKTWIHILFFNMRLFKIAHRIIHKTTRLLHNTCLINILIYCLLHMYCCVNLCRKYLHTLVLLYLLSTPPIVFEILYRSSKNLLSKFFIVLNTLRSGISARLSSKGWSRRNAWRLRRWGIRHKFNIWIFSIWIQIW